MKTRAGFTLIELSIVLVIIALIIGGVLVGRDLIATAALRTIVTQQEQFGLTAYTFKSKYGALPGDIPPAMAANFGFFAETTNGGLRGHGDNNGLLEGAAAENVLPAGENLSFWRHLSESQLITGQYGMSGNGAINPATGFVTANVPTSQLPNSLPGVKGKPSMYFLVYSEEGSNRLHAFPITGIQPNNTGISSVFRAFTPIESYAIDSKLDDGKPNTGSVLARSVILPFSPPDAWAVAPASPNCTFGGTTSTDLEVQYNVNEATGGNSDTRCSLQFRF